MANGETNFNDPTYDQSVGFVQIFAIALEEGDLIGYIGNPTKYYSVEGANLYIKMTHNGEPVDPMDYLNYE